jgi:hypothetical protein
MPTLHKHFHVIVFFILVIFVVFLQLGPFSIGWPIQLQATAPNQHWLNHLFFGLVRLLVNLVPCVLILSLCMLPFGYDSERTLSIASLLVLTMAASLCFVLLPPGYVEKYHPGEHVLFYFLTTMALNGVFQRVYALVRNNVELPEWKTAKHPIDETDST